MCNYILDIITSQHKFMQEFTRKGFKCFILRGFETNYIITSYFLELGELFAKDI